MTVIVESNESEVDNLSDVVVTRTDGRVADMTGKSEDVEA